MTKVLSIDLGTGGARAGVYDIERRKMFPVREATYETRYPKPGWAEQDAEEWWRALLEAGAQAVAEAGTGDIAAVCVATTASSVAVCDREGVPLRPALLWMDARATKEARDTARVDHPVMAYSGGEDACEWLVPKAMWLAANERPLYDRAAVICEALDFINYRLTGEWAASRMNAACKWNYDSLNARFVPEIYEALDIPDLPEKLPRRVVPVGGTVAPLRADVASRLGITSPAIVAQGGIDAHIGMLGAGTVAPGGMLLIGGTSNVHLTHLAGQDDVSGFWGPYPNALVDGLWLVEAGQVSAGSILNWLSRTVFGLEEAGHAALVAEATARAGEASGLLTLDYWMGNRTPYRDANLRGAILGLSLGHGRADIYASAVDSIALGSANVVEVLKDRGVSIDRLVVAGGICKNPLWLQSTVDALGRAVEVAREDNLSLVGTAVASATALGLFPDLAAAAQACSVSTKTLEPDMARAGWYREAMSSYRETTEALTPLFHTLSARQMTGANR